MKKKRAAAVALLAVSVLLIAVGICLDQHMDVLIKAVNICLECVGLG